ncbi:MAG TPA: glycosyltransferase 87 family protein, partial [Thermomicrobiales bacterium]|nr:glycosyltransferase 87 family protein [Thermomicrobiales bacterium]
MNIRLVAVWSRFGPYVVSSILLLLGYLHYAPGAVYSLSAQHYRTWSFPAFRYSDLIWLYLRDGLDRRPLPYVDYLLEYPPLTGLVSWLLSWAPDLPTYFTLAYSLLTACSFLTIWALQQIGGANVWLFAASPALFFYTGHQWDMAAIGVCALALLAMQRDRTGWGVAGLVIATSLKLFPVVFVAAAVVERIRDRRFRSAATMSAAFAAGTLAINIPVAFASVEGWSFFFRWNRDRLADSGIWVLWRGVPTQDLTRWSLVAVLVGGLAFTAVAFRSRGPVTIPLGATYLLWWLLVNKTFTTHLMLWAFLSIALLSAPWWLWGLTSAADLVGFQLGNYLNLYNVSDYQSAPLIRKAVENIYDPVQIARSAVLLVTALWGAHILRVEALRTRYAETIRVTLLRPETKRSEVTALNEAPRHLTRRGFLHSGAVALAFAAATVLMTWPYAGNLGGVTVVGFDPFLQIWLSEWIQHALTTNPLALYDANIFYPFAQTLAYTDANVPGALLAAPLRFLTGDPLLTNSVMVLATFVVAATGVYALTLYLTQNHGAAFIVGLAYAFLPYRMVHLWHLNWLEGAFIPWMILALVRVFDRPSIGRGVVLGLLGAMLVLISFYFSVQIALVIAAFAITSSLSSRHRPSLELWRSLAVAMAVILT